MKNHIDVARSRELFFYSKITGKVTRRQPVRGVSIDAKVGSIKESGAKNSKRIYLRVSVDGQLIYLHRLIWVWVTGEQPDEVDHKDGNGLNNKWENLKNVPHSANGKNQKIHTTNTSGTAGVCYRKDSGKWRARIMVDGRMISLGAFTDKAEAITARQAAEAQHGFGG